MRNKTPPRSLLIALLAAAAACSDDPSLAVAPETVDAAQTGPLDLGAPALAPAMLVAEEIPDSMLEASILKVEEDEFQGFDESYDAYSGIFQAKTVVGFEPEYAYARGEHWYSGNKGRVETTAYLSRSGSFVGSQDAAAEGYNLFLLDMGRTKYISTTARIYAEEPCGLSVRGHSSHTAWWQFYYGNGVATWGHTESTTDGAPQSQGGCDVQPTTWDTGFGRTGTYSCHYLIEYDPVTGNVYATQFLYCGSNDYEGF